MQVAQGGSFTATLHFGRPKTGFVGIYPAGMAGLFSVTTDWGRLQSQSYASANFSNTRDGSVSLTVPSSLPPGSYTLQTIVPADGGTLGSDTLEVTAGAAAAAASATLATAGVTPSPPAAGTLNPWANAPAGVYTAPVPEPAASDGAKLSQQGSDIQAYYVANYGPGMLAATQFVIDHEHQLAAIGSSTHPSTVYTPPPTEPAASDGEKLSMQSADVQAYYVTKYGPGFLAATGFVNERNASLGTSIPGGASTVLPANGGAGVGGASGTDFSSILTATPNIPTAAGQPPPTVGALVQQIEHNKPLLIGLAVGAYFLLGGRMPSIGQHRR